MKQTGEVDRSLHSRTGCGKGRVQGCQQRRAAACRDMPVTFPPVATAFLPMITLQPISGEEFPAFFEQAVAFYAAQNVAAGRFPQSEALEQSRADALKLLPQGVATPDHFFFHIVAPHVEEPAGYIWLASLPRGSHRVMFVVQVFVRTGFRRRGYARQALLAAEGLARNQGLSGIALHVFSHNVEAQALYRMLGYQVASLNLLKPLEPRDDPSPA